MVGDGALRDPRRPAVGAARTPTRGHSHLQNLRCGVKSVKKLGYYDHHRTYEEHADVTPQQAVELCRHKLRPPPLSPTQESLRLATLTRIQDLAGARHLAYLFDDLLRRAMPHDIAFCEGIMVSRRRSERPALALRWVTLEDPGCPPLDEMLEQGLRVLEDASPGTRLIWLRPERVPITKVQL